MGDEAKRVNKPLLILPPAPNRWLALEELLGHEPPVWLDDLKQRFVQRLDGALDALAVVPDGSRFLACACIRRRLDIGVLGQLFTQPPHRGRGHARRLMQTLLSWFDMTGGKWLYACTTPELYTGIFEKFGFRPLHRHAHDGAERMSALRTLAHTPPDPYVEAAGDSALRDVTRADWPLLVALEQHWPGADRRIAIAESAVFAETAALELIAQQERGTCVLNAEVRDQRVVGLASVATDALGERTYAMVLPHDRPLPELRAAIVAVGLGRGYTRVDFPMDALS